jgi:hypothetical protein
MGSRRRTIGIRRTTFAGLDPYKSRLARTAAGDVEPQFHDAAHRCDESQEMNRARLQISLKPRLLKQKEFVGVVKLGRTA